MNRIEPPEYRYGAEAGFEEADEEFIPISGAENA
jgi:hypothetical protein